MNNTGVVETGGCTEKINLKIKRRTLIPVTNHTGHVRPRSTFGWRSNPPYTTGTPYEVESVESCFLFFPRFETDKKYLICSCDNQIFGVPEVEKFSLYGSPHSSREAKYVIGLGDTGFMVDGKGSSTTRMTHLTSGLNNFIVAPGYYSHSGEGFGYSPEGIPSGSPSGEKINITGILGRFPGYSVGKFICGNQSGHDISIRSVIPCSPITGSYYAPGVMGVHNNSIWSPNVNDSGYGAKFAVKSDFATDSSVKFFIASGHDPIVTSYEETPAYTLHRGYEYFFSMDHVSNHLNAMRFSYHDEDPHQHGEEITGWYGLEVPGSTRAYNNYILYNAPKEVSFTVPVTGNSYSYTFDNCTDITDNGLGTIGFNYGVNVTGFPFTGVENLIIDNVNDEDKTVTGWLDSLSGNGEYIRIHNTENLNYSSFLINSISHYDTYRKVGVNHVAGSGSFADGDSVVVSPSGDGRVYYYATIGTGYGGSGYFDITDTGCWSPRS